MNRKGTDFAPATVVVTIGDLTPDISRRLCETARDAARYGHRIVVSLGTTSHISWAGLCQLARYLRERPTDEALRFTDVLPRTRSLMREVGLSDSWIIKEPSIDRNGAGTGTRGEAS